MFKNNVLLKRVLKILVIFFSIVTFGVLVGSLTYIIKYNTDAIFNSKIDNGIK